MNEFFNNFKQEAQSTRLAQSEKQVMRHRLYEMMERFPAVQPAAPLQSVRSVYYSYNWFAPRYMVPVAALLLVVLGSGTTYAAQSALPGQPLYAIKVNINEAVQVALATTPQAKAEVNASIAQTRLEEAETLASQGDLTASTSAQIAQNFDEHAQAAQTITQSLQTSDPAVAAQLSANFDSSLSAHDAILAQIASTSESTTTKVDSATLAIHVRSHEHHNGDGAGATSAVLAVSTEAGVRPQYEPLSSSAAASSTSEAHPTAFARFASSTATSTQMSVVLSLQASASTTLAQAQNDFAAIQDSLSASTSAQTEETFGALNSSMSAGAQAIAQGNNADAKSDFESALRHAVRLDAFLKAAQTINKTLLPELLNATSTPPTSLAPQSSDESSATTSASFVVPTHPISAPLHLGL